MEETFLKRKMRKIKFVDIKKELELIEKLGNDLLSNGYNASNSIIIIVSTDYSSIAGQILRHKLSYDGEVVDGFGIDVPYPDETWDESYRTKLSADLQNNSKNTYNKNIILVEAGVIRGSNYAYVVNYMNKWLGISNNIITTTLFENISSNWQSDFVGEYYDDVFEDLTFWWETDNKHWK